MPKEEPLLLVRLSVHSDKTTTGGKEDDVFIRNLRPLKIVALLWRVTNDMLKFHDWVHVELRVDLPCFPNVHASLIWSTGGIAVRTWHAKSSHT